MAKPLHVKQKKRFHALALPLANNSGLRPDLDSGDYVTFTIHDGSKESRDRFKDSFFGKAEIRSNYPQWYSINFALTYPDPDPEAPKDSKIHYMFKALPPSQLDYLEMKRFTNRVLSAIYDKLGRGVGTAYASIMPPHIVEEHLRTGRIVKATETNPDDKWFDEYTVQFLDELHYVDPATIPKWENEQRTN